MSLAYQAADVLFVPSLYEGLPRVVIEAWRWSTPVVATDRVALATLIADGRGRVVPYGSPSDAAIALGDLLTHPDQSGRLGRAGRSLVESNFLLPRLVEQTVDLYRELARP
jgi:glycosyltransferase involved in cell wall biosynthesis